MNKEYFNINERDGFQLLTEFNIKHKWFTSLDKLPPKSHCDASGITKDGRKVIIEIKKRNLTLLDNHILSGNNFTADTIYIESHKIADMLLDTIDGYIPIYVNFLNNCEIIYVVNQLKHRPKSITTSIKSNGYEMFELGKRQMLSLDDAIIYVNGRKLQ